MAVEPIGKFKFSFADLALPVAPPRLLVLEAEPAEAPPEAAGMVAPAPRPRPRTTRGNRFRVPPRPS
jgi:hypothetical protein